jgi:hypothetical protein
MGKEPASEKSARASKSVKPTTAVRRVGALEAAGVEFTNGKRPGVRMRVPLSAIRLGLNIRGG